jgi:two-component system, LytTR family, response regulator
MVAGSRAEGDGVPITRLRALIVDDEPLARQRLRDLLADIPAVLVVGEAGDGVAALDAVRTLQPDVLFLDVHMPELNGVEVVAELDPDRRPHVIFATAYDDYAVHAFDAHAVDYLMKPISPERLGQAVERAARRATHDGSASGQALDGLLDAHRRANYRTRFAVRAQHRFVIVDVTDLRYIEAADNYVRLHAQDGTYLFRSTMAALEESLDPAHFLRIHRSYILRIDQVSAIEPWAPGEYSFNLTAGDRIVSSRSYARRIRSAFGL